MSYELQLFFLLVVLYVYDSSALLYSTEAILVAGHAKSWRAETGWNGFLILGRVLCILNPLTPARPSFRLHWDLTTLAGTGRDQTWSTRTSQFQSLAPMTLVSGVALYLVLPLGLFTPLGAYAVIPAAVLLYTSILLALRKVAKYGLMSRKGRMPFLGFAFECLACPPFSVNMVRRLTLAMPIAEPLPLAAARLLSADRWETFKAHCLSRIDEALLQVDAGSADETTLQAQRLRLQSLERAA